MSLLWATRGRSWGFRFLLDAGEEKPLAFYEKAFMGADADKRLFRVSALGVTIRFPDPVGRTDTAGRVIPHDFVVTGKAAVHLTAEDDALRLVWPYVADVYASVWSADEAPTHRDIADALPRGGPFS